MIATLDYAPYEVVLKLTSDIEKIVRANSCAKEPETIRWIESLPPGVFYDIGANIGAYSFVAGANKHEVLAFEPPGPTYDRLLENITLNPMLDVTSYPFLLGDVSEPVRFSFSSLEPGAALHSLGAGGDHVEKLQMWKLDDLIDFKRLPWPRAMKIDTDGSELRVLIGAEKALERCRSVLVELDDSLPASGRIPAFLGLRGFSMTESTRHGTSKISNVRFDR